MRRAALLALCILILGPTAARADFYRWVDKDGREFYTNDPNKIPAEYRDHVSDVKPDEHRVSVENNSPAPQRPVAVREHKDKNGHGEAYWRGRAEKLRTTLRKQQDEYDRVLNQLDDQDRKPKKIASRTKKSGSSLEKKKVKLEKEIAQTRREQADLEEEARRADAYPGWVRE